MAMVEIDGIEDAKALVGQTIGPCEWRQVTQADIDDFAASPATTSGSTSTSSGPRPRAPTG